MYYLQGIERQPYHCPGIRSPWEASPMRWPCRPVSCQGGGCILQRCSGVEPHRIEHEAGSLRLRQQLGHETLRKKVRTPREERRRPHLSQHQGLTQEQLSKLEQGAHRVHTLTHTQTHASGTISGRSSLHLLINLPRGAHAVI